MPTESSQCSAICSDSAPSRCTCPIDRSGEPAGISPSKKSNPWLMPVSFRSTYAETTPPVAKPRSRSICGSSRSPLFTVKPTLSRTPVSNGSRPESSAACAGSVCGACEYARSKTMPSAASASIAGVFTCV